jgi:hypothetical protein
LGHFLTACLLFFKGVLILIEILDLIKGERKPPAQTVINLSDDDNLPRREDRHPEAITAATTTLKREKTDTNGPSVFGGQD